MLVEESKIEPVLWGRVFDDLLHKASLPPTVATALEGVPEPAPVRLATAARERFLGHMDTRSASGIGRAAPYPLDPTQRLAAIEACSLRAERGKCILPINGPPGTGKTSFLRAVLASGWVQAALDKALSPPIVIGTGATNKAVSNIIEAFSDVPGNESDLLEGRWIQGLPSYGWLFPSTQAASDYPGMMQLGWQGDTKNPYSPQAGAAVFAGIEPAAHGQAYLALAREFFRVPEAADFGPINAIDMLHGHIKALAETMRHEQHQFDHQLGQVASAWQNARRQSGALHTAMAQRDRLEALIHTQERDLRARQRAVMDGELYLSEASRLLTGWRSWLPEGARRLFWRKPLEDLCELQVRANAAFAHAGVAWSPVLPLLRQALAALWAESESQQTALATLRKRKESLARDIEVRANLKAVRSAAWRELTASCLGPGAVSPSPIRLARHVRNLCGSESDLKNRARDALWGLLDARHDLVYRVRLFHLSARYWEGRWIQAESGQRINQDSESRIRRLMMLGVIIVATTHKLCALGENITADLLVMDEAGQCAPEVAIGALAFTRRAIFVGDTRQLQPVCTLTRDGVRELATSASLPLSDLPDAVSPEIGSGMAVAQRASAVTDNLDEPGISLLHHYRCHPRIAQFFNEMLYAGKMLIIRADRPTPAGLPPMSWVAVDGRPEAVGGSWINWAELEEIARWIVHAHSRLVARYGCPIEEILAVITPLAAQATLARRFLRERLSPMLGAAAVEKMTIGTVHKLQGAERPVVVFSLVQTSANDSLFADRNGGQLLNVAVSRAKDAFVIFANQATLRPAPADDDRGRPDRLKPVAQLGRYLRRAGTRLYPRSLVVVEAPGKVDAVARALEMKASVIATDGNLRESSLAADGALVWSEPPEVFVQAMKSHAGLVDEIVIATDDDIAGELIGTQVAEIAAQVMDPQIRVRRMRFHALTVPDLQTAFEQAGGNFDADFLAAGLVREYARHFDRRKFAQALAGQNYVSAVRRDIVALVDERVSAPIEY